MYFNKFHTSKVTAIFHLSLLIFNRFRRVVYQEWSGSNTAKLLIVKSHRSTVSTSHVLYIFLNTSSCFYWDNEYWWWESWNYCSPSLRMSWATFGLSFVWENNDKSFTTSKNRQLYQFSGLNHSRSSPGCSRRNLNLKIKLSSNPAWTSEWMRSTGLQIKKERNNDNFWSRISFVQFS